MTTLPLLTRKMLVSSVIYLTLFAAVTTSEDYGISTKGCSDYLNDDCNICSKWAKDDRCEKSYAKIFCKKTCGHCQADSKSSTAVTYLGCYHHKPYDSGEFLKFITIERRDLSVENCVGQCATNGFPYAGLQGGLYCLCSSAYGKYDKKVGDEECSMECPGGSPEMKCGGTWKNAVYEIRKREVREDSDPSLDEVEKILIQSSIVHMEARLRPQAPVEYPLQLDDLRKNVNYRRYQK